MSEIEVKKTEGIDRSSRASKTREKETRRKPWAPPSMLDAPPAPDGYKHRWIRAEVRGFDDQKNISARLREGYELVRQDEFPDFEAPVIESGKYAGVFGVGGLFSLVSHWKQLLNVRPTLKVGPRIRWTPWTRI